MHVRGVARQLREASNRPVQPPAPLAFQGCRVRCRAVRGFGSSVQAFHDNLCWQGQLLYVAYNDYDAAESLLARALQLEPSHLLARVHLDVVGSLRRAATLVPYHPLPSFMPHHAMSAPPLAPAVQWGQPVAAVPASWAAAHEPPGRSRSAVNEGASVFTEGWTRAGGAAASAQWNADQGSYQQNSLAQPWRQVPQPQEDIPPPAVQPSTPHAVAVSTPMPHLQHLGAAPESAGPSTRAGQRAASFATPGLAKSFAAPGLATSPLKTPSRTATTPNATPAETASGTLPPPASAALQTADGAKLAQNAAPGEPDEPGEMPPEAGATLDERLRHTKWNVRAHAYQEVACAIFRLGSQARAGDSSEDAAWAAHAAVVAKGLGETNVMTLDKALNAAVQFLEYAPLALCKELAASCAPALIAKGLAAPRNGAKVQDVLLRMIQAEAGEQVVPQLVLGMKSKNSKQAAASAQAAREALLQFGPVPTQARQLLVTACIALFDSSTAAVRAEALSLSRQLLLVLGTSIRPLFDSLRPIQVCLHACLHACLPQWQ